MRNLYFNLAIALFLLSVIPAVGQPSSSSTVWGSVAGLVGDWSGLGAGKPGEGMGEMSIRWDLDRHVLVNRSHSEYPAQGNKPAIVHDQMMIIYPATPGGELRAITFDNEGHTIEYAIEVSGTTIQFVSASVANAPRFRLTYVLETPDTLSIKFDIAPPGAPDKFAKYIEGIVKRQPEK